MDRKDVASELLTKKGDFFEPDSSGKTSLHYAYLAHGESSEIFKFVDESSGD